MRHRIEYALFLLIRGLVLLLPLKSAQRFGSLLGTIGYRAWRSRRRVALDNLTHAFPELTPAQRERIAEGAFRNYGIAIVEFLWFPRMSPELLRRLIRVRNVELLHEGYARGRGMVMLSGHFGNWELIAFGVAHLSGLPMTIIVQTQSNALVDRAINRNRCLLGNSVVPMGIGVREVLGTLKSGGIVAIAPDQSGPMEGVFVDFFGRSVATHQGPAAFALKCGADMQMGFIVRQPDMSYEVVLERVSDAGLPSDYREAVEELTRRHTRILEAHIRQHPDHWMWMHRRWKHTWESVHGTQTMVGAPDA
jgi:KDO2-lipid IV(A) lauroyltransferase